MTWEIVLGLITLVGAVITIGTVVFKLASILATLSASVNNLSKTVGDIVSSNNSAHEELFDGIDEVASRVDDHELRIHDLERDRKIYSPSD